jgi:diguanylate cyclase (GGDEF)-like protein/PAS domain S-box-containing protein
MTDRMELLEAALDNLPEGIALLGEEGLAMFWNPAAEAITGYSAADLLGRPLPEALEPILQFLAPPGTSILGEGPRLGRGSLVHVRHKLGHDMALMARVTMLRNGMGGRIGMAAIFHPSESLDALPRGESGDDREIEASQTDLEDRLEEVFKDFTQGGPPFGLLWITVDQLRELRKTHGARACDSMIEKMTRALGRGLRPAEALGRWGENEFLIVSHERSAEMLAKHAQAMAGLARTADFRWWGDKVSLTVSIGAAQSEASETLAQLLGRAKAAMLASVHAGGNHITLAPGRQSCLPS